MQCHDYSPLTGHATIVCVHHSLFKCGVDTGYPIKNVTPATSVQLQAFIMHMYWDSCVLVISDGLLIYRGGRQFSEPFVAGQHWL